MDDYIYEERPQVWEDTNWLSAYPLNVYTVLDYFSNSHFYDLNSLNEKAKKRRPFVPPAEYFNVFGPGIEFALDSWQEPHLFVIRKQFRASASKSNVLSFFYVFTGRVYPAPSLQSVLASRITRCVASLQDAEHRLQELLGPHEMGAERGERAASGDETSAPDRKPFDTDLHQKASAFAIWDSDRPRSHQSIAVRPSLHHQSSLLRQYEKGGRIIGRVVNKFHLASLGKWEQAMAAELAMIQGGAGNTAGGQGSVLTASGLEGPSMGGPAKDQHTATANQGPSPSQLGTHPLPPPPPPPNFEGFQAPFPVSTLMSGSDPSKKPSLKLKIGGLVKTQPQGNTSGPGGG